MMERLLDKFPPPRSVAGTSPPATALPIIHQLQKDACGAFCSRAKSVVFARFKISERPNQ
jgi:hypothetical protein